MKALVLVTTGLHLGYVGCYGNEWIATPALDQLAAEGVVFDQHLADQPTRAGARRAFETGCYSFPLPDPAEAGTPAEAPNLLTLLQQGGVATYLLTDRGEQLRQEIPSSWERIQQLGSEGTAAAPEQTLDAVAEALDRLAGRDCWLLQVEWTTLLPPWQVPEKFREDYADEDDEVEEVEEEDTAVLQVQHDYAAAVTYLDHALGTLFDELDRRGLSDHLLLVHTGDHGQSLGERSATDPGPHLHEELIHLPFLIRLPGRAEAGKRIAALTQPVDLLPTLLDAFGLPPPPVHGHSLMPLLLGKADQVRAYACAGLRTADGLEWALRTPEWGLLVPAQAADGARREPQLYVKPDDRWEVNDVRQHHLEWTDRLEQTLHAFVEATRQAGPLMPPELPEA